MDRFAATTLLVFLASLVCEAQSSAPGYSVRIPRAGIDAFLDGAAKEAEADAAQHVFAVLTGAMSNITVDVKDMRISKYERPRITYTLQEPNKFLVKVNLPKIVIKGSVDLARGTFASKEQDKGNVEFIVTNTLVELSGTIGIFENGIPRVDQVDCKANSGPVNLTLQNFSKSFARDALTGIDKELRPTVAAYTCTVWTRLLAHNPSRLLAQFPNVLKFSEDVQLKGQIKPAFTQDSLKFSFFEKPITGLVSPRSPVMCDINVAGSPQAVMAVSDALFDNALYLAYKQGSLNFTFSPSSPPALYKPLSLDCGESGVCLGNVDKKLPERFGKDALVEVQMKAPMAPTLEFKDGRATMTASWGATLYITPNQKGAKRTLVASSAVTVGGSWQAKVQDSVAYARVTIEDIKLKVDQPALQHWEQGAKNLFKDIVQMYANDFLSKGMPVPSGLKIDNASIKFREHCMQALGDVNYKSNPQ